MLISILKCYQGCSFFLTFSDGILFMWHKNRVFKWMNSIRLSALNLHKTITIATKLCDCIDNTASSYLIIKTEDSECCAWKNCMNWWCWIHQVDYINRILPMPHTERRCKNWKNYWLLEKLYSLKIATVILQKNIVGCIVGSKGT